jgi:hypothetical protein
MAEVWVRPELRDQKSLVTPVAFGESRGMESTAMASRLRRYADKAPQVVMVVNNRTRYYLESDLVKFLEDTSSTTPRSAREVAYAEIVHLEQVIAEGEAGLKNHDTAIATSEDHLRRAVEALSKRKEGRRKAASILNRRLRELDIARARMDLSD